MSARYLSWSVPKLKKELVSRGASTNGRKTDLLDRLQAYERNQNFRQTLNVQLPQQLEVDWPVSGFTNLKEGHRIMLPKITAEQTQAYFVFRLAGDNEGAQDIKAIEKGKLLYQSGRVLACSVLVMNNIYFSGIVSAAMKNKVTYSFKLKLEKKTCDLQASHCECPAGKGPHGTCKHLAAVMVLLEHFTESGTLNIEKSCTENLQMFNKPKVMNKGSPVKVDQLPSKRKIETFLHDPRPEKYRKMAGYQDRVRNLLINYTAKTSKDIAFRYLHKKANVQVAALDHDYCKLPYTEYWIDRSLDVDDNDIHKIEQSTRGQSQSKKWFNERSQRITASRFGEICRITDRRNKYKLCASIGSSQKFNNVALSHGKNYEKKAINQFEKN